MIKHERECVIKCGEIEEMSYEEALSKIRLILMKKEARYLEFDLVNTDCSIANALRRILMSETETVAIEKVFVCKNTGVMPDETLAHRLGLIPADIDPEEVDDQELEEIRFRLSAANTGGEVMSVYSGDIECLCPGRASFLRKDVLVTKLAPGQEIELEMTCMKGTGKEHAKWSPVCPATYRLMPHIEIGEIYDEEALKLRSLFSEGVIEVKEENGRLRAFVKSPRLDSMSREALRHKEFEGRVHIGRVPNHFIFSIESVYMDPLVLLKRAICMLVAKAARLKEDIINKDE